jgi:hypothetical protein
VELHGTEKELLECVWNCMELKKNYWNVCGTAWHRKRTTEIFVELNDTEKELLEFVWNCMTLKKNYWNVCGTAWH